MIIACCQMDVRLGERAYNFARAEALVRRAASQGADVILLPETWNLGFFPREGLAELADPNGENVQRMFGTLARELHVNIAAGSAVTVRGEKVFNTACVFDREGACVAAYDKTHLFTPMGEHESFTPGDHLCTFTLDGVRCGLIICYDLRFPELTRSLVLQGADLLFVPAEWPAVRPRPETGRRSSSPTATLRSRSRSEAASTSSGTDARSFITYNPLSPLLQRRAQRVIIKEKENHHGLQFSRNPYHPSQAPA